MENRYARSVFDIIKGIIYFILNIHKYDEEVIDTTSKHHLSAVLPRYDYLL